jgi:hypothetical protein
MTFYLFELTKEAGSESGFISQRYGTAEQDPYQNCMDQQHCKEHCYMVSLLIIIMRC